MPHESEPTALALNQLSSGEKHLLAIVADLAIRMIELNPKVANPLKEGQGIIIIDEIDTHLHPLWQRKVLEKVRNMFPLLQISTTTHSPFVASLPPKIMDNHKLDKNIIYELENGTTKESRYGSGQSIDYILSELMDVDHRNKIVEDYIYLIRQEEHESEKGKELKLIIDELDPNSSDMMRINFALQRLKARKR
jgi:predicted ATP-binding protein involved in virulence